MITRASPAIRWRRRCSRTASAWSRAASSTTGRAASSPPARRSRTRSSSVGQGARAQPNTRATQVELYEGLAAESQNSWPNLHLDFGAAANVFSRLLPGRLLLQDLHAAEALVGMVRAQNPRCGRPGPRAGPARSRPLRQDATPIATCWSSAAGRPGWRRRWRRARPARASSWPTSKASSAARCSSETAHLGGATTADWAEDAVAELAAMPEVRAAAARHRLRLLRPQPPRHPRARRPTTWPSRRRTRRASASGRCGRNRSCSRRDRIERPLVFADNDRPGDHAGRRRAHLRQPLRRARRAARADLHEQRQRLPHALDVAAAGGDVAAVVDLRAEPSQHPAAWRMAELRIDVLRGHAVVATKGRHRLKSAMVMPLNPAGDAVTGEARADLLRRDRHVGRLEPVDPFVFAIEGRDRLRFGDRRLHPRPPGAGDPLRRRLRRQLRPDALLPRRLRGGQGGRRGRRLHRRGGDAAPARVAGDPPGIHPHHQPGAVPASHWPGGEAFRRLPERRDRGGYRPCRARRLRLGRACQALHHGRHGHRPGQDVEPERAGPARRADRRRDPGGRHDDLPPALHAGHFRRAGRARHRRPLPAAPPHAHAELARAGGRGLRGRRPLAPALFLSTGRGDQGAGSGARGAGGAQPGRHHGRLDARQDRHQGAGRVGPARLGLHQRLGEARRRPLPLRR